MTSLLPPNATAEEQALEQSTSRIGDVPVPVADVWNPYTCPENALPFLAWAFSVDHWDVTWSLSIKRQVVAIAIQVHRIKGTLGAIEDALAALDVNAVVSEWFSYGGDAYKFKVNVELAQRVLSPEEYSALLAVIHVSKNVRSHLDSITLNMPTGNETSIACAIVPSQTVEADLTPATGLSSTAYLAAVINPYYTHEFAMEAL